MLSTTAFLENHNIWVQDVTHAYIQDYGLEGDVCINPAAQFQHFPDTNP